MVNFAIVKLRIMNIRIKILLVGIVQLTGLTTALAHNPVIFNTNVRSEIEHMFEEIDTLRIPTGFLRDYATDIIDLSLYNGQELNDFNCSNRIIHLFIQPSNFLGSVHKMGWLIYLLAIPLVL